jgi:hypothetical protein
MKIFKALILVLILNSIIFSQSSSSYSPYAERLRPRSATPATCRIGQLYADISTVPAKIKFCGILDTYTEVGGGTTINSTNGSIPYRSSSTTFADSPLTRNSVTVISSAASLIFGTDNTYDIGAIGATRPRNIYIAGTGTFGGAISSGGSVIGTSFIGGTASSCTVSIKLGGNSVGMTYSNQACRYTQIGNTVTIAINLTLSAKGSSIGVVTLTGLPVAASSSIGAQTITAMVANMSTSGTVSGYIDSSLPTQIQMTQVLNGTMTSLHSDNLFDTSLIFVQVTYLTN